MLEQPKERVKGSEKLLDSFYKGKGWREALADGQAAQAQAKREDMTRERMEDLAKQPFFTFEHMEEELRKSLKELEDGMTTITKAKLFADTMSGGKQQETIDQQKADAELKLRILGELNEHERALPKLLDRKARQAIAAKLSVETKAVDETIFN